VRDFPSPLFGAQGAPPSLLHVFFCCYCLSFSFFPFFPGGDLSVQRAMLIWPKVVCGSTACCLAHRGLHLPKPSGHCCLVAAREPSWLLRLM
jgi:hypothetical protein